MVAKSREQALFGAAVLKRRLERSGLAARGSDVYEGVLEDLGLSDDDVDRFLADHGEAVDQAVGEGRSS